MQHPRFRAGYDFLLIRAEGGDAPAELADWWTRFQDAEDHEREAMLVKNPVGEGTKRKRRRKPRGGDGGGDDGQAPVEVVLG